MFKTYNKYNKILDGKNIYSHSLVSLNTKPNRTCDVCIIGSGIMGLNTAYQIARRSPNTKIMLFEKSPGPGYGSSGASSAICRSFYSLDNMAIFSKNGIDLYKNWNDYLKLTDEQVTSQFHKIGMLCMLGVDHNEGKIICNRFNKLNIPMSIITESDMKKYYPYFNTDIGIFDNTGNEEFIPKNMDNSVNILEEEAGYFEPTQSLQDIKLSLQLYHKNNVFLYYNSPVKTIRHKNNNVIGITLENNENIDCKYVINCNGPWYNRIINELDGLDIPFTLVPVRVQVIYKDAPEYFDNYINNNNKNKNIKYMPIFIDSFSGTYCRPQIKSKQILCGSIKEEDECDEINPDELPTGADPDIRDRFLNSLLHRLPILNSTSKLQSISGLYTMVKEDVHPIIGPTKLNGLIVCNGFSGHGYKCGPAVGSIIAQYITNIQLSDDTRVPIQFFSP